MREMLKPGKFLYHRSLDIIRVEKFLGSGGQGEVYQVACSNQPMALKWYYPNHATEGQAALIDRLCEIGPPNNFFLWPTHRITDRTLGGFGYLMPLRPAHYRSIVDLMKKRVDPSFRSLIMAALNMVDSFKRLHDRGLCYRDISFGNVFFDKVSGNVLICDNDNIAHESAVNSGVLGTPRFMAPEIVTGSGVPNVASDLYSLSVLLFYLFFIHHPLEGKMESEIRCFDLPAMTKLYGTHPIFIFDPNNRANRPVSGLHDNAMIYWNLYPRFIKDLFTRAFTEGLTNKDGRIPENEWLRAFEKLLGSIQHCSCGAENFYDVSRLKEGNGPGHCWACKRELTLPTRMKLNDEVVVLCDQVPLFTHQISGGKRQYQSVYGKVKKHPTDPGRLGLQNLSEDTWQAIWSDGSTQPVEKGQTISLEDKLTIRFPSVSIEIRQ